MSTGTKPGSSKADPQKVKHDFKTSTDGRLIIGEDGDDSDDDAKSKTKRKAAAKRKHAADDEDDLNDLLDALSGHNLGVRMTWALTIGLWESYRYSKSSTFYKRKIVVRVMDTYTFDLMAVCHIKTILFLTVCLEEEKENDEQR